MVEFQTLKCKCDTLQSKIGISQSIQDFNQAQDYQNKITDLKAQITQSKMKSEEVDSAIKSYSYEWNQLYTSAQKELQENIENASAERSLKTINDLAQQIKDVDKGILKMQSQIKTDSEQLKTPGITEEEVQKQQAEVQNKVTQYKLLLHDKSALFEEMYLKAMLMINRDKQIVKNEEEIVQLKQEIDINILEIEQKTAIISELQELLKEKKAEYKQLKKEIRELEAQCEELEGILKQKTDEFETLEDVLRDKDVTIAGLEQTLGEKAPTLGDQDKSTKTRPSLYKAIKGDIVDELLAKYINDMHIIVPIKRLEFGYYVFGTKKIYAKVLNNKLVVRVGGGYMSFTEFIESNSAQELKKI